ncbi:WD repeat-containing protein 20 [Daktulosphaira vitifoliae]|uniref:WD repeat-containing protein 20 n=1 Tax=Daktulosphaira vitifoliae TaxID=58002 RepID=UPI0021AA6638|nr:WD repeat-containing protein 20 [Daktulosphaira vitifoliae]
MNNISDGYNSCMMSINLDSGCKEQLKTQFVTREGVYKLLTLATYSRPNRIGYNAQTNTSVHVSFINYIDSNGNDDRICFNIGRELFVFYYKGTKKGADLTKPIDKKIYKGISPTCHDFNSVATTEDSLPLIVGFSTGLIQLIDPIRKDVSVLFNEEKMIDKTKVTCIRWVPNSKHLFLVSHASGQLYLYNETFNCGTSVPNYQLVKSGEGYAVHMCKTKSSRNPVYRWLIGCESNSINEFEFSPCGLYLAIVSQDGFLRVFNYEKMELIGIARSYFGGFLCVCWSPDSRYIVVGGEDDLVTVYSISEQRVVARGQGHHSWVSVVAFDPYTSTPASIEPCLPGCYRLGSVGHDTQLCLWDITDDVLHHVTLLSPIPAAPNKQQNGVISHIKQNGSTTFVQKPSQDPMQLIGTAACPRFDQCPRLEPLVCKKIAHDRLTALVFREDCFVAACQNGYVYTWARPGTITSVNAHLVSDPSTIMSSLELSSTNPTSVV